MGQRSGDNYLTLLSVFLNMTASVFRGQLSVNYVFDIKNIKKNVWLVAQYFTCSWQAVSEKDDLGNSNER